MKTISILIATFMINGILFSQARLASTEYQKTVQPAVEISYPYPEKTVSKAFENKLEKMGYKGKESKGYMVYKGVRMAELGPDSYDLYIKTERKSKKEKDESVVTMMISSGNNIFVRDNTAPVFAHAQTFLDSQMVMVEAYDLEVKVAEQEEVIKKTNKKMKNLTDEAEDLQKKKRKIEEDIEANLKAQENQKAEVATQGELLNTLMGKRKQ